MIIMHGLFDLADGVDDGDFRESFEQFSSHLESRHLILASRCMRHQDHYGYNSDAPATKHYISVEFTDMDSAQSCWDYIEGGSEPVNSLHTAVFSKIRDYRFFLTTDI